MFSYNRTYTRNKNVHNMSEYSFEKTINRKTHIKRRKNRKTKLVSVKSHSYYIL